MRGPLGLLGAVVLLGVGCVAGNVSETLTPIPFTPTQVTAALALKASPGFADERGGGVFIDISGVAVRLQADGSQSRLEAHPGNRVSPGPASAVWPLGPFSAVVATSQGLFVADSGWLIEPPWRELLSADGLIGTALDDNGVGWLAHTTGLFRLEGGVLSELKAEGTSLTGITAIAVAPGADSGPSVWVAQGEKLSYAERTSTNGFVIKDSGLLPTDVTGGITALAGLAASTASAGELWAIADHALWRFAAARWQRYDIGRAPRELKSAGRVLWLLAGDSLYRYDADASSWAEARGLTAVPTLLAADASGAAWVRIGEGTVALSAGVVPRLDGLFQNERVYGIEAVVLALMPKASSPTSVFFKLDDGVEKKVPVEQAIAADGPLADTWQFSFGGLDATAAPRPASFAALEDGPHSVTATATFGDGTTAARVLYFQLKTGSTGPVGWAADIKPIFDSRCHKCHTDGPGRDLSTYELWVSNQTLIVNAVKDQRMPADGLMDPTFVQRIARWANGGALP